MRKVGKVLAMLAAAAITAGALAGCGSGAADKESSCLLYTSIGRLQDMKRVKEDDYSGEFLYLVKRAAGY